MTRSSVCLATGLAVGAAAAGMVYAVRKRHRYLPRIYLGRAAGRGNEREDEEEENCSICLGQLNMPCVTGCGHRFCTGCFINWWRRSPVQPGQKRYAKSAKCPLCTQHVRYIRCGWRSSPFRSPSREEAQAAKAVGNYNWEAWIAEFYVPMRRLLAEARNSINAIVLSFYGGTNLFWVPVHTDMDLGGMWRIPRPRDEKWRFLCLCGCLTTVCSTSAQGIGHLQALLMPGLIDVLVKLAAVYGDFRHAELDDVFIGSAVLSNLRVTSCLATVLRTGSMMASRYWQDTALAPAMPHVMRTCETVELVADIAAAALQFRVEILGIRALVLLMQWQLSLPVHQEVLDMLPIASTEAWLLPIDASRVRNWLSMDTEPPKCSILFAGRVSLEIVAWSDALSTYGVGLKALQVFHGLKPVDVFLPNGRVGQRFRGLSRFPNWALTDVATLPPISALMRGAGAAAAIR